VVIGIAGFRPGERATFVSAKGPKTIVAVARPFGCPSSFADFGGPQTRYAQTMRAFLRNRLHDLALPQGHGSLVKEGATESLKLLKNGMDVMFCAAGRTPAQKDIKKAPVPFFWIQGSLAQGSRH